VLAERGGTLADPAEHHLRDARGFTRGLFNASAQPLAGQSFDFDAFGNPLDPNVTPATDWLAPDGRTDAETGFTYHLARYSNRQSGRWISRDPTIFAPGQLADANLSLFVSHSPVMYTDPSGLITLGEIGTSATLLTLRVAIRVGPAFAAGGVVLGRFMNAVGLHAQRLAQQTLTLFPRLQVLSNQTIGNRVIDFVLRFGSRTLHVEAKYRFPSPGTEAFGRLVAQLSAVRGQAGDVVVFAIRRISPADMRRLQEAVGADVASRLRFASGVDELYEIVKVYFGL
jgi:RHS repeat-associated protein